MDAQLDDLNDAYSYARLRARREGRLMLLYALTPLDVTVTVTNLTDRPNRVELQHASAFRYSVRSEPPAARCWTLVATISPSGFVTPYQTDQTDRRRTAMLTLCHRQTAQSFTLEAPAELARLEPRPADLQVIAVTYRLLPSPSAAA